MAEAEEKVQKRSEAVRAVATAPRFSELKSQARERMSSDSEELARECEDIAVKLAPRLEVIEGQLQEIDEHRRILVSMMQRIGGEAGRIL